MWHENDPDRPVSRLEKEEKKAPSAAYRSDAAVEEPSYEDYDYLERFGENYFQPVEGAQEKDPEEITTQVYSGYLETSNISVVSEMVNMITVARSYESNQKVITTYDGTLDIAANQLGRLS